MHRTLSVRELNEYVAQLFTSDEILTDISLTGEISNFTAHRSGHLYFSLKDTDALIRCVMFRQYAHSLLILPANGDHVTLTGYVSLFARDGQYQFNTVGMRVGGQGELFIRYEALKAQLRQEGLFDAERKKSLPMLPMRVALVTSPTGAALHDMIRVAQRRYPGIVMEIFSVKVQGIDAAQDIVQMLDRLSQRGKNDVIVLGRGGGSIEELWAFNQEALARGIARCNIPVISAIGHETDYTIADFVADLRAPTPSAAMEMIIPERASLDSLLTQKKQAMKAAADDKIASCQRQCKQAMPERTFMLFDRLLADKRQHMDMLANQLRKETSHALTLRQYQIEKLNIQLRALNPDVMLARGYARLWRQGHAVTHIRQIQKGDQLTIAISGGRANAAIQSIEEEATK